MRRLGIALVGFACGCTGPVLSPVHPMTALPAASFVGGSLGAGAGSVTAQQASVHDTKVNTFVDGELEVAPFSRLILSGGVGYSAPHPVFTIVPGGVGGTVAARLVLVDEGPIAIAVAPRAAVSYTLNNGGPADEASALQAPLLVSIRTPAVVLTLSGWYRYFPTLRSATDAIDACAFGLCGDEQQVRARGHGIGGAMQIDFGNPDELSGAFFVAGESVRVDSASGTLPEGAFDRDLEVVAGLSFHVWFGTRRVPPTPTNLVGPVASPPSAPLPGPAPGPVAPARPPPPAVIPPPPPSIPPPPGFTPAT